MGCNCKPKKKPKTLLDILEDETPVGDFYNIPIQEDDNIRSMTGMTFSMGFPSSGGVPGKIGPSGQGIPGKKGRMTTGIKFGR